MKFDINREGGDYIFKTKVGGVLVEIFRVTDGGNTTFSGSVQATGGIVGEGSVPIGGIISWIPGYFADGANGTYARMLGATDDAAGANAYLSSMGYRVCDGSLCFEATSPIFNGASRYLPNLTDNRFLQGSTGITASAFGGSNTLLDHTHAVTGVGVGIIDISHAHAATGLTNVGEAAHTHTKSGGVTSLGTTAISHSGGSVTNLGSTSLTHSGGSVTNLGTGTSNLVNVANTVHVHNIPNHYHVTGTIATDGRVTMYTGGGSGGVLIVGAYNWAGGNVGGPDRVAQASTIAMTTDTSANGSIATSTLLASQSVAVYNSIGHGHGFTQPSAHDIAHGHDFTQPSAHDIAHGHSDNISYGAGSSHTHTISGSTAIGGSTTLAGPALSGVTGTGNTAPNTDSRPKYLRCFYIMRVH